MRGGGAIKELFPSSSFIHKISCLDSSGLKGRGMLDSLFATYGVSIIPRETGLEDEKTTLLMRIYSFFLSPSDRCFMNHSEEMT